MPVCTLDLPAEPLLTTQQSPPPPQQQQQQPPPTTAEQRKPPPIIHPSVGASATSPILLQQSPPSPASLSGPPSPDPSEDCSSCPHCQAEYGGARPVYWRIQLDRDLLETILSIYPEWFKDCNLDLLNMADNSGNSSTSSSSGGSAEGGSGTPNSPPKAEVDDSPLQKCMDKNKESLKVKLMLRRPINQLVAQGIMPPLKTPPAFHEQRQKLERAKTGDLLKAKIQQRPDRQELVRQHILEGDVGHVDPSLAERQRMLKKARLQDSLNDQLSHRPGPLELIKKNILHTDETIERAVKEGQIPFRATCEGQLTKPQHPNRYITLEEDSSSEGGQSPPQQQLQAPPGSTLVHTAQGQTLLLPAGMCFEPGQPMVVPVSVVQCQPAPAPSPSMTSSLSLSSLSPISSVASPQSTTPSPALVATPIITLPVPVPPPMPPTSQQQQQQPQPPPPQPTTITVQHIAAAPSPISLSLPTAPISISTALTAPTTASMMSTQRPMSRAEKEQQKNRKKSKTKTQPKARTIKFHEYKGPPNANKSNNSPPPVETSYELLLQQQQLFLQWQLEWQHKYPQIILPAAQKPPAISEVTTATLSNLITVTTAPSPLPHILSHSQSSCSSQVPSIINVPSPVSSLASLASPAPPATPSLPPPTPESIRTVSKLEDMKVNDLKAELKKRNLPVSGSKPQLIERLRPFSEQMGLMSSLDQPATPSSVSSHHGMSDPKSVGTLALGDDSLSGLSSMDTPGSPLGGDGSFLGLEQCLSPDNSSSNNSPAYSSQPNSPLSLGPMSQPPASLLSPDNMDVDMDMEVGGNMDTTAAPETPGSPGLVQVPSPLSPASPPAAKALQPQQQQQQVLLPLVNEDIITQQQRRIEHLQRELQKSQQQLHKIKSKDTSPAAAPSNQMDNSTKNQLQQHLQHKMQQQKLHAQLQQLQALQQLHQQQQQQQQAAAAKQQAAVQQPQQQPTVAAATASAQQNVKASLAAFLQQQQQISVGQSQQPLLLSITTSASGQPVVANLNNNSIPSNNNNNNNNETTVINNKHKSQLQKAQQQKLALNQINLLQKQRSNTITQATNAQVQQLRTASLPNFFGSFVQQNTGQQPQVIQITQQQQAKLASSPKSETQFVITKPPPPLYEEATKFLKVQIKDANSNKQNKHIKSQIVEDVLEILIKNGELPPSAAQVPVTPTTPGQSNQHGLVFKAAQQPAEVPIKQPAPPTPPPLPPVVVDQDNSFTLNLQSMLEDSISAMTLPESKASTPEEGDSTFAMSQLDMILGQTGNNPLPISVASNNILQSSLSTNPTVDLKDLGLDLETMDFGQLDPIKLEATDLLAEDKCDSVLHNSEEEPMEGVVSAGDMPMDLDMSDWLESLLPSSSSPAIMSDSLRLAPQLHPPTSSHQAVHVFSGSSGSDLDSYDPLLSNSQDVFDLFNLEDTDLKMSSADMNPLTWDKVDFAA